MMVLVAGIMGYVGQVPRHILVKSIRKHLSLNLVQGFFDDALNVTKLFAHGFQTLKTMLRKNHEN